MKSRWGTSWPRSHFLPQLSQGQSPASNTFTFLFLLIKNMIFLCERARECSCLSEIRSVWLQQDSWNHSVCPSPQWKQQWQQT